MPRNDLPVPACAQKAIRHVREKSGGRAITNASSITINFHPDALHGNGLMIESLARDGIYRSQFETGISNGALNVSSESGRFLWESRIFGGAYDLAEAASHPKYGALNDRQMIIGASPRFGSAHIRLQPHVLKRVTFCYPDSHLDPKAFGVPEMMGGFDNLQPLSDPLDTYVEAHIHGAINLSTDVSAIVLDPSFRNTTVEASAHTLGCRVQWHPGFSMPRSRIPECRAYRGARIANLADSFLAART